MVPPMALPKGKSLSPPQNARVRAAARALLERHATVTALADVLGLTQAGLSSFLTERTGAGFQLAGAVARESGVSLGELIDGTDALPPPAAALPLLGNARGWDTAEAAYRARVGDKYPEKAYELARQAASAHAPDPITEDYVGDIVMVLWKHYVDPSLADRQQKKLDAQIKGLRTKGERRLARRRAEDARANDTGAPLVLAPPKARAKRQQKTEGSPRTGRR